MVQLKNKELPGVILPENQGDKTDHPKNRGRYRVYIPTYMQHRGLKSVLWCKNHIHNYRYGINEWYDGDKMIYGEYKPLHEGSRVIVKFFANDIEAGYIDRVISDYEDDCLPFALLHEDQNDVTVVARTGKNKNLIAILEDIGTPNVPENTFHIYYDDDQVRIIMNPDGQYTWVAQNKFTRVHNNYTTWVHNHSTHHIDGVHRRYVDEGEIVCVEGCSKRIVHGQRLEVFNDGRIKNVTPYEMTSVRGFTIHETAIFHLILAPIVLINCWGMTGEH